MLVEFAWLDEKNIFCEEGQAAVGTVEKAFYGNEVQNEIDSSDKHTN
ncbi:hypothetical protein [Ornithinibacillus xuwenensis]